MKQRRPKGTFLLRYVPEQLIEYPLESLIAMWGITSGMSVFVFENVPLSIQALFPNWVGVLWGILLGLGGTLVMVGLARRWYASVVPRGLQLISSSAVGYALTILADRGVVGIPVSTLMITVAILCGLRAWFLQVREEIFITIAEESAK